MYIRVQDPLDPSPGSMVTNIVWTSQGFSNESCMSGNNHRVCAVNPGYNDICLYVHHYIFLMVMGLDLISNVDPMYYESWMYTYMYL